LICEAGKRVLPSSSGPLIIRTVVGVVLCLDQEIGKEGEVESAKASLERDLGGAKVFSVLTMQRIIAYLEEAGRSDEVSNMKEYREKYGIKTS